MKPMTTAKVLFPVVLGDKIGNNQPGKTRVD
jgi:hypothetical protein